MRALLTIVARAGSTTRLSDLERRRVTQAADSSEVLPDSRPLGVRLADLAAYACGCGRGCAAGGGPDRGVALRILSLRADCADRVGGRCRARTHGGDGFFGAAGALARNENASVAFFVEKLGSQARRRVDAVAALVVLATAASVAWYAIALGQFTTGQTTGSGLPLELTFYPMGAGALCMTIFALALFCRRKLSDIAVRRHLALALAGAAYGWRFIGAGAVRAGLPMLLGFVGVSHRRRANRVRAGVHRAHLHLDRRRPARPHLRSTNGARHRQFRAARDPVLHPGRLPHGGERHVRPSDRAARTPGRTGARRAQRGDGAVDGDLLRHFRLEDGRCRGGRLGADPGGPSLAAKPRGRSGVAGGFRGDGGNHPAVHQSDHTRLRRQSLDRRTVHGGIVAGRPDGARLDRGRDPAWRRCAFA